MEGEGNSALLEYINKASKNDRNGIDIDRSLFVINAADGITQNEREDFKNAEIKYIYKKKRPPSINVTDKMTADEREDFKNKEKKDFSIESIKLVDKKLLFTSAKEAYAAKSKQNGIATTQEVEDLITIVQRLPHRCIRTQQ
jgi:hemolysin activation/secretion protein